MSSMDAQNAIIEKSQGLVWGWIFVYYNWIQWTYFNDDFSR